jgi:hypothetical protein|tara:strand:+ start:700 stop:2664 length:1965 start_codon:yes stop_codon:yes gene_type:complete
MAGYSARQSTYTTGDVISAADSNDEFNQLLAAFNASTGHTHDGTAGDGGPVSVLRDSNAYNKILLDSSNNHLEFYVNVSSSAVQQLRIQDGAIVPITDDDIDLGTSSLEFKDLYVDGTAHVDAINFNGTAITSTATEINLLDGVTSTTSELNIIDGDTSASSVTVEDADRVVLNDGGTMKQVAVTDLSAYFDDEITAMPNLTSVGTLTSLTVDNIIINGTNIGHTSDTDALAIDSSGNVTASQNLTVTGDLTVSGDDITMGTNTAGNLLIADGTNFNSVAVSSLSEISSIASDDVFLAIDTSGGGLKKVARSTVVSGLATSSAISNVAEDSTPQLGGNLDVNGNDIVSTSNANIDIIPNGSGVVNLDGTEVSDGLIELKTGTGSVAKVKFYCESGNAHAQTLQAAPHSAASSAVLVLPTASGNLVGTGDSGTVTNTMLAGSIADSKLNTISTADKVSGAAIQIDGATDGTSITIADSDKFLIDDGGTTKYVNASQINAYTSASVALDDLSAGDAAATLATTAGNITIDAQGSDTDIILKGTDGSSDTTFLTIDGSAAGAATFNSDVTVGALLKMPDVTSGKILVGDGTSFEEVAVSGDATLASSGAVTLANTAVSAGSYTAASITVDAKGRITSASSGSAGVSAGFVTAMAIAL